MTLGAPLGLLLGALAAPLLALWFLKVRRRRVTVPSTLLWQEVLRSEAAARPFDRLRRNLLLLLQLLALAALAFALARPSVRTAAAPHRTVVLVLDGSASMNATDITPSRFAAAVRAADDVVAGLGGTDEVMVVLAGARTGVPVPFTRDLGLVRSRLAGLSATEAEGSLREGLQLALSMARSRGDVEVVVFSDGSGEDLSTLSTGGAEVRYVPVGRSADNVGIVALDLRRSPTSELDRQLFVTVENFGAAPTDAEIAVYLGDRLLGLRDERVPPDAPVSLVFDLPGGASGRLQVTLDADGDHLPTDDVAYAVLESIGRRRVLLVGGDPLTTRALAADPRVSLERVGAADVTAEHLDRADAVVLGAPIPFDLDGRDVLVLGPFAGPASFGDEVRGPRVVGWRRTHPALRFVEWGQVAISRARRVTDPGGLVPVVDADTGALVLAGERAGGRVVQLAFDPLRSDLPLRVAWPVLLLNAVGWLTEASDGSDGASTVPTGAVWARRVPDHVRPEDVRVDGPGGRLAPQLVDGLLRVRDTTRVGVYEVRAGEVRAAFAADLLSPRESRIAPRSGLGLADGGVEATQASVVGRRSLWRPIALLAIVLLLLEWLAYHRRRVA